MPLMAAARIAARSCGFMCGHGPSSKALRAAAHAAARIALDLSDRYERVVIAAMRAAEPIVEVVERTRT